MITDIHNLQKEISKAIKLKIAGIPVLIAEQSNPSLGDWVSFKLTNWEQLGSKDSEFLNYDDEDDASYKTETLWKVVLNIVFIGNSSEQNALTLAHNFNKESYLDNYETLGLYYLSASPVRPSPIRLTAGWQQRHTLDITFNTVISDTEDLDFFNLIEVQQTVKDWDDTTLLDTTFTIDLDPQ